MSDVTDPRAWLERATQDDKLARLSLRQKPPLTYGACFHAQQCAEKCLKALLVASNHAFSKIHDLLKLRDECAQAGIQAPIAEDKLSLLSSYAVRVRYPGEDPTLEEAREAVETATAVLRFTQKFLQGAPS